MAKAPLTRGGDDRVVRLPRRPRASRPGEPRHALVDLLVIAVLGLLCLWFYAQMNPPPAPLFATPTPAHGAPPV